LDHERDPEYPVWKISRVDHQGLFELRWHKFGLVAFAANCSNSHHHLVAVFPEKQADSLQSASMVSRRAGLPVRG
jgi:hypothetical protein